MNHIQMLPDEPPDPAVLCNCLIITFRIDIPCSWTSNRHIISIGDRVFGDLIPQSESHIPLHDLERVSPPHRYSSESKGP